MIRRGHTVVEDGGSLVIRFDCEWTEEEGFAYDVTSVPVYVSFRPFE